MFPLRSHPVARGTTSEFELPAPLKPSNTRRPSSERLSHVLTNADHKRTGSDNSKAPSHKRRPSFDAINDYVPLAPQTNRKLEPTPPEPEPIHQGPPPPPWTTNTRPLSDIRELTEPSLVEDLSRKNAPDSALARKASVGRQNSLNRKPSKVQSEKQEDIRGRKTPVQSPEDHVDRSSIYSIPPGSVPPRSSSQHRRNRSTSRSRVQEIGSIPSAPRGVGLVVPNRGRSRSPIKDIIARYEPVASDVSRRVPSRTFYRGSQVTDIAESPVHRHPRINVEIHLGASLFVGGGSIEGTARISIDDAERIRHKRALAVGQISVDLVGIEEVTSSKRSVFLNLATELIDADNPPPHGMVETVKQISAIDPFWHLAPSISILPFTLSLPLDVGPPPFNSKHARIRYLLSVTLLIRDQGKQYLVRQSQDVTVIPVYDPEKALMSLPSPLTAADEHLRIRESTLEIVHVTAGLHRQVWVSGTNIFVDVHVSNNSRKSVRRMELQLERDILCYKHAAASTMEKSASQARIFDSNERSMIARNVIKAGHGIWSGIAAHTTEIRTCDLAIPRGHATVKCGKFFEVRYFLNIIVGTGHSKLVTIQLPIVLIHMNSLDVVPNSVAQVAAAIEEKRAQTSSQSTSLPTSSTTPPPISSGSPSRTARNYQSSSHPPNQNPITRKPSISVQGRAFAAPRMQSLDRMRADQADHAHLTAAVEASPRKIQHSIRRVQSTWEYGTPTKERRGKGVAGVLNQVDDGVRRGLRRMRSGESVARREEDERDKDTYKMVAHSNTHKRTASTETVRRQPSTKSQGRSQSQTRGVAGSKHSPSPHRKPTLGLQREPGRFDPHLHHQHQHPHHNHNQPHGNLALFPPPPLPTSSRALHSTPNSPHTHHKPTDVTPPPQQDLLDGFRARLEEAKQQRQFQFQFRKKKSGEGGWKGWLRSLDREGERDARSGNWI